MRIPLTPLAAIGLAALVWVADSPATAAPAGWKLVFEDNFKGSELDATKWSTTMEFVGTHGPRYHNEFYVSYTVDEDAIVADGMLRLRTDRRTVEGAETPGMFDYTQGLVSTHGKFSFLHGYVEIRAKYPGGKGLWPCFWLMPQHQSWPPEFDIAEYYGGQHKMHHGLAHGTMQSTEWDSSGDTETDFVGAWHTIALEWTPGHAAWLVDGEVRKVVDADYVPNTPMYILLSNSVSSRFGPSGEPDEKTVFPNFFEIAYVRVYQPAVADVVAVVARNDAVKAEPAAQSTAADAPRVEVAAPAPADPVGPAP